MTGLVGGKRIAKNALRIETYGTVDELSSAIGIARAALRPLVREQYRASRLDGWLSWTQDMLFNLGAALATPGEPRQSIVAVDGEVDALERAIDEAEAELIPLANFIHPGGSMTGAHLHFARTICRRAERLLVTLVQSDDTHMGDGIRYLNRLSDALFVWARWINDLLGVPEYQWNKSAKAPESSGPSSTVP
ncbi:MAG: cob(I)yrinic acid a,c-diamide adenosyltransferase [Candidatus Eremiobacteraeota bacterium]|nr:cob(I)yrinic acid a,c-diamide adenosyltransferase [Candidatus Eremiobacteraeota bacterium]